MYTDNVHVAGMIQSRMPVYVYTDNLDLAAMIQSHHMYVYMYTDNLDLAAMIQSHHMYVYVYTDRPMSQTLYNHITCMRMRTQTISILQP